MKSDEESAEIMDTDSSRKRKGGATGGSPTLKRQNSCPNIKESSLTSAVLETKYVNVGDIIVKSFSDKKFIEKITPVLTAIVAPLIKTAINEAVVNAVTAIEKGTISKIKTENEDLKKQISSVESVVKHQETELENKSKTISELQAKLDALTLKVDGLEQYGRRTSVRLINMKIPAGKDCEKSVLELFNNTLGVPITADEIDRCHPLGNQVIVKFRYYKSKAAVFKAKSKLKDHPDKIFMTEDLTKTNHSIVQKLLQLRKSKQIHGFWTQDAKIYLKVSDDDDTPVRVSSLSDINALALPPPDPPVAPPTIPPAPPVPHVAPEPVPGAMGGLGS